MQTRERQSNTVCERQRNSEGQRQRPSERKGHGFRETRKVTDKQRDRQREKETTPGMRDSEWQSIRNHGEREMEACEAAGKRTVTEGDRTEVGRGLGGGGPRAA